MLSRLVIECILCSLILSLKPGQLLLTACSGRRFHFPVASGSCSEPQVLAVRQAIRAVFNTDSCQYRQ